MEPAKIESKLRTLRKKYLQTKHRLFVWKAYKICRDATHSIPSWILEYIDTVASKEMPDLQVELELGGIENFYEENQNPVFLWEALKLCLDTKYPIPDWVSGYFSDVASKFLELADITKRKSLDKKVEDEVFNALGMEEHLSKNNLLIILIYKEIEK